MADETGKLLELIVQELRGLRCELSSIRDAMAPFVEERRAAARMQSPLMGVDLFRASVDERRG